MMPVARNPSGRPLARYASLANYVELTRSLGADPGEHLREAGIDPAGLTLQDRWIPADAVNDLLERTAAVTARDDFGLRLAELRRLSHLGPLSLVLREEPDVRSALTTLIRHERMYNEALHPRLIVADGVATVRVELALERPAPDRQASDLAVGVLFGLLQVLLGGTWTPLAVSFAHPAPRHTEVARRMFSGTARYDQDFNGITLYEHDLDSPTATADPQLRMYTRRFLAASDSDTPLTATERTRQLVDMLLPTGLCTADQIARSLGIDRRTLHRHLAAEGTTFTAAVDDARADLARHLVAGRRYTFTETAQMLGFSSPSNFSRWFRGCFGCPPRTWRAAAHTPAP